MDFRDISVIDKSRQFADTVSGPPADSLTPAQLVKLNNLEGLIEDVGDPSFDTEVDVLIAAMTEIRDR